MSIGVKESSTRGEKGESIEKFPPPGENQENGIRVRLSIYTVHVLTFTNYCSS